MTKKHRAIRGTKNARNIGIAIILLGSALSIHGAHALDVPLQIPIMGKAAIRICVGELCGGIGEYIALMYRWLVGFAAVLAVLAMTWGGVQWLISGGESGKIQEARKVIGNALIGLLLALGSYVVLTAINPNLTRFNPLAIKPIQKIELKLEEYKEPLSMIRSDLSADNRTYNAVFKKYADEYGVDCTFVKAMAYQESGFENLRANSAGAVGLLQVVHTKYGRPSESALLDPETNVKYGVGILKDAFSNPCPASCGGNSGFADCKKPTDLKNVANADNTGFADGIQYALAAYNAGVCGANQTSRNCSDKARWQCPGEIPRDETLKHVPRVFGHYKKMKDNNWGC